ncbi:integrase core domain-containing protein [Mycolicibacterium sp. jd]|uniref:integrase core domain-containing protein n=1 Tax=unclassified Mycolicibacterium TaxID=2636767 RepID=UPI00351AED45
MAPAAMAAQNRTLSCRQATVGLPGDGICPRYNRTSRCRSNTPITHLREIEALRRPVESAQYTSTEYATKIDDLDMRASLGRTGICWDNALAESFFASLKNERVHHMVYPTRKKAQADIARYIELFYNRRRLHSALGYRTPHEVRTEYMNSQLAA